GRPGRLAAEVPGSEVPGEPGEPGAVGADRDDIPSVGEGDQAGEERRWVRHHRGRRRRGAARGSGGRPSGYPGEPGQGVAVHIAGEEAEPPSVRTDRVQVGGGAARGERELRAVR